MWFAFGMAALFALLCASPAAAQAVEPEDPLESPELRELRLAERALFGEGRPLVDADALHIGSPPPALTSDARAPRGHAAPAGGEHATGSRDLSFLRDLELPDLPVRWDDQVVRYLEFYRDDPRGHALMSAWLRRERRFGPVLRAKLREMGLPEDLSFIAMIESGFDPHARSHAGAIGMWQFVRPTAEEYGLTIDHWLDERRDPERSTEAGARYLSHLYRRFGSWELAFAAYNMGYGALLRAMRKFNTNDYWVLARLEAGLPFETTFYVAKAMACAVVGRNPERFGFQGLQGDAAFTFDRVEVPGGTPFGQIARASNVAPEVIAELNPELVRQRVPPGAARAVRIPAGMHTRFATAFTRMSPRHPAHRPYVVRFGETLADVAQRFRTTESALRTLNALEEDARVIAGFDLMVPAVEPEDTPAEERPVVAIPDETTHPGLRRVFYRVTDEDSAPSIARFFGVSVDDLRRWNHVDPHAAFQRGMVLQLFVAPDRDLSRAVVLAENEVRILVVGTEEFHDWHEAQQGRVRFRYTVQPGDTLTSIAQRFELSVGSVGRINRFARDTVLRAGQEILVYAPRDRVGTNVRREYDERLAAQAAARGEAPPEPRPAIADDGDGDDTAARNAEPSGPAAVEPAPAPAPTPDPVAPGG